MLREDYPGGRILSLRRRRSRLPWIYLVYQEDVSVLGQAARPLPHDTSQTRESVIKPRAAKTPARRTPTGHRDRCRQPQVPLPARPSSRERAKPLRDRAPAVSR